MNTVTSWRQTRIKMITTKIGSGKTPAGGSAVYEGSGTLFLRSQNIHFDGIHLDDAAFINDETDREMSGSRVHANDSLLNITGASLGRVARVTADLPQANVNQHVCIVRPSHSIDPRYLSWCLASDHAQQQIRALQVGGNRDGLNFEQVGNLSIPLPLLVEQRRIADFLDAETAQIDRMSELRLQQISAIDEVDIARTFDAVRGAHEPGARKSSNLTWLGSIPKTWRIAAVSHLFYVELGKMLNQERAQGQHLRPYLRVANIQWDKIETDNLTEMNFPPEDRTRYRLRAGDLLVCEGGSWPGRAAIWDGAVDDIYYQKALHRIRPIGTDLTRWLYYCLRIAERMRVFLTQGNSSTITHLTREQLRPQRFPFPDVDTQRRFVIQLDEARRRDARLKSTLDTQLDVLNERRQALITAAVTGQIDVTTAHAPSRTGGVGV